MEVKHVGQNVCPLPNCAERMRSSESCVKRSETFSKCPNYFVSDWKRY